MSTAPIWIPTATSKAGRRASACSCFCRSVTRSCYAHRNLIVHLDLKPSNILVTADGTVKLLDFGTSKLIEVDSRLTTTVMATPAYASPEQLRNEAVTTSCDIYALGAILFELLAGHAAGKQALVGGGHDRAGHQGAGAGAAAGCGDAASSGEARPDQSRCGRCCTAIWPPSCRSACARAPRTAIPRSIRWPLTFSAT
jgi:DNA-binding helix-hairpin-helix protein with protein kinase domain